MPPGRCVVLILEDHSAVWVTSWPEYAQHDWSGAWINTLFRNEGRALSSELILEAVAATRARWEPPELGMVTFVDPQKIRRKRDPGRCYRRAGFHECGRTAKGLVVLQLLPAEMPDPDPALGTQATIF